MDTLSQRSMRARLGAFALHAKYDSRVDNPGGA